jgi:hypothetical protein
MAPVIIVDDLAPFSIEHGDSSDATEVGFFHVDGEHLK